MQKEEQLLEKRLVELSNLAYRRDIVTYSDFLNLNELNILHSLPKDRLYTRFVTFGGYDLAERQMAAFLPDALYLRTECEEENGGNLSQLGFPFKVMQITPLGVKYAESLTHRDYLGAVLNLGIERSKLGDIMTDADKKEAVLFVHSDLSDFLQNELTRVRHTAVSMTEVRLVDFQYSPHYEEIKGTVASVRLDSLLALAFSSSRSRLTGLIEGAKVFVNGRLMTSNGFQVKDDDIISVRGMGKFQYKGTLSHTKKGRVLVLIYKYV